MLRRILCVALCALLTLPALPAAAQEAFVMAGYEEKDSYRSWSANLFFERMRERSGVALDFAQADSFEAWQQVKAGYMAPGAQLPDVLFKAGLSPAETISMLDAGVLIDLAPLIEEHAPTLYRLLDEHPDARAAVTLPGGRIGALPYINLAPAQNALWINADWLSALKLQMPTTAQELEQVLAAFKAGDPNRNGRADELPLSFLGAYDLKYLAQAFGLAANDFNVFVSGGQVRFMPLEPAFRDFIAWCRGLYERGLIDKDGFSTPDTLRRVTDAKRPVTTGALLAPLPTNLLPAEWLGSYAVVPPLEYQGRQVYRTVASRVTPGTFAITAACKDPARMLEWVDYLYTEEGAILASAGLEGIDYLVDGDGSWRKTPGAEQSSFLSSTAILTGSVPPGASNDAFQRRYHDAAVRRISAELDKVGAIAADPFPPFSLTAQQEAQIGPLQAALGRCVDESIGRWVTGEWAVDDAAFQAFSQQLSALGVSDFLAFWQGVLDQDKE